MPIEFNCQKCGTLLRIEDAHAGKKGRCPTCQSLFDIPGGEAVTRDTSPEQFQVDTEKSRFEKLAHGKSFEQDNNPYAIPRPTARDFTGIRSGGFQQPHRGTQILVFAILGLVCCVIFGIVAWTMANEDLNKMRRGDMDPSGEGLTQAGRVIAIISLAIILVSIAANVLFGVLGAAL